MKKIKQSEYKVIRGDQYLDQPKIKLFGETITVGPGTVPTSAASVTETSITDVVSGAKKASKLGLFEPLSPITQ